MRNREIKREFRVNGDDRRQDRLRGILQYQLDLELLLRLQEKKLLEMEITRAERIREVVELSIVNDFLYTGSSSSSSLSASPNLAAPSAVSLGPSPVNELERIAALGIRPSSPLSTPVRHLTSEHQYEMRSDGSIVMLRCPKCLADKFKSPLGFVNHCRIHCHVIFSSPEDRQTRGAVPVNPNTVPVEVFGFKHPTQIRQEQELAYIRSEIQTLQQDTSKLPSIHESVLEYPAINIGDPDLPTRRPFHSMHEDDLVFDNEDDKPEFQSPIDSRPMVQKSVIIGNEATCLIPANSLTPEMKGRIATHKWKIYVRPGDYYQRRKRGDGEDYCAWLKGVRFVLHDSYEPSVVEVMAPVMELELDGYGEFPVRVQLLFWDDHRNKSIEFVHHVRIFMATKVNRVTPGPERLYSFELDRDTDLNVRSRHSYALPDFDSPKVVLKFAPHVPNNYEFLAEAADRSKATSTEALFNHVLATNPQCPLPFAEIRAWFKGRHSQVAIASPTVDAGSLMYCRYCGLSHEPQGRFYTLQKNCSQKPRKIKTSTRTSASSILDPYPFDTDRTVSRRDFAVYRWSWLRRKPIETTEIPSLRLVRSHVDLDGEDSAGIAEKSETILAGATSVFLKALLSLAISRMNPHSPSSSAKDMQCLTPWHVYSCLTELPEGHEFDFLTNSYMSL